MGWEKLVMGWDCGGKVGCGNCATGNLPKLGDSCRICFGVAKGVVVSKIGDKDVCGSIGGVEKAVTWGCGGGVSTEFRPSRDNKREKLEFMERIISLIFVISPCRDDRVEVVEAASTSC
jgi:hypothetical protein